MAAAGLRRSLRPLPLVSALLMQLLLALALLSPAGHFVAGEAADTLAPDTPVSQLLELANARLAAGSAHDALDLYNKAVSRDPDNYLTLFKRAATQLALGRTPQAAADFDKVLVLKPGFEGALTQRGKIRARKGDWAGATKDWKEARLTTKTAMEKELSELGDAEAAALSAGDAAKAENWETCVTDASAAIRVATQSDELRRLRARCRLQKNELAEAFSDLSLSIKLSPGGASMEASAAQAAAVAFFGLAERDKGLEAVRACLHSDPESKVCVKQHRKLKRLDKEIKKAEVLAEKRSFASAAKALAGSSTTAADDDQGVLATVREAVDEARADGQLPAAAKAMLVTALLELTCDAYLEMNSHKRGAPHCTALLADNPEALPGLLHKAQTQLDGDDFEGAVQTLGKAGEHHQTAGARINPLMQKAQTLLKRSKSKDYYKVLGVDRDASDKEIKRAFLKASKLNHPDKVAGGDEAKRQAAEKKMITINEAYEVLKDPELRARFDAGDDPNDPESQARGHGGPFHGSPFGGGGGQQFVFRSGPGGGNPFGGASGFAQNMFGGQGGGGGFRFQF